MFASCSVTLGVLAVLAQAGAGAAQRSLEQIDRAASMFAEEPSRAKEGFNAVLAAAAELAPQLEGLPPVASHIAAAREQLRSDAGAPKASESLQAAYKALSGGSAFTMPDVEDLDAMTVQMKRRLAVARKAVEASQVREEIERSCYPADEQR
jgi:hypothetical protein